MYTLRAAEPSDCDAIAEMVRNLARDIGAKKVPKVMGSDLRSHAFDDRPLLMLTVAEGENGLAGCCVAAETFSTWRGVRGLYIIDLYVAPDARNAGLGQKLLRFTARQGLNAGARFIRMEVDKGNAGAERFYKRLGFSMNDDDRIWVLERPELEAISVKSE